MSEEIKALLQEYPATIAALEILDGEIKKLTDELNPRLARRSELVEKLDAISRAKSSAGSNPAADTQQAMPKVATSRKQGEKR